jgi:phytoene synthase
MKINSFEAYKNSGKIYVNNLEKVLETVYSIYDFFKLMIIKDNKEKYNLNYKDIYGLINLDERI